MASKSDGTKPKSTPSAPSKKQRKAQKAAAKKQREADKKAAKAAKAPKSPKKQPKKPKKQPKTVVASAAVVSVTPSDSWSVIGLRTRAREVSLPGYSRMSKAELLEHLSE